MLEREVVDFSPNITFDDIAELQKAKDVLEEAVAHGNCLVLFAYLRTKRKQCESLAQEQVLLATLLDWFRHIKMRYVVHHYFCYRVHRYFVSCCFNQFVISIQHGVALFYLSVCFCLFYTNFAIRALNLRDIITGDTYYCFTLLDLS